MRNDQNFGLFHVTILLAFLPPEIFQQFQYNLLATLKNRKQGNVMNTLDTIGDSIPVKKTLLSLLITSTTWTQCFGYNSCKPVALSH